MNEDLLTLDAFADRLVNEKGLEGLDPEVKEQVTKDLINRLADRVNAALLENLPREKMAEFNSLLEENDEAKIQLFVSTSIPHGDEVIAQALMSFRETYLNG